MLLDAIADCVRLRGLTSCSWQSMQCCMLTCISWPAAAWIAVHAERRQGAFQCLREPEHAVRDAEEPGQLQGPGAGSRCRYKTL